MDVGKFSKVTFHPLTEDMLKVNNHLKNEIPKLYENLLKKVEHWRLFAISTMLTLFNNRRRNEVFQLMTTRFKERENMKKGEMAEIKHTSSLEIQLMKG